MTTITHTLVPFLRSYTPPPSGMKIDAPSRNDIVRTYVTRSVVDPTIDTATIERFYTFEQPEVVRGFLDAHEYLLPLVFEAVGEIQQDFPESSLLLAVDMDPDGTYDQLVMYIETPLSAEQALDRLSRIQQRWWLDALDRAHGQLGLSLTYR